MARHESTTGGMFCALGAFLLAGCSSVRGVNDQALLLESADAAAAAARAPRLSFARLDPSEYRIGPRDLLEIDIYELEAPGESKKIHVRVSQTGRVVLPLIGAIQAAGRTADEVQLAIETRLAKDFIHNPSVSVLIAEFKARRITVLGEVNDPGAFELKENATTLVNALALAGSPTREAGSRLFILRAAPPTTGTPPGGTTPARPDGAAHAPASRFATDLGRQLGDGFAGRLIEVDLTQLVEKGDMRLNYVLQDGDLVHVPKASMCFVTGLVHYPGGFPIKNGVTLLKAIALAGGARENASPELTVLLRMTPKGRISIPIDLAKVEAGTKNDLPMQAGDVLVLSESTGSKVGRGFLEFFRGLFTIGYSLG